MNIGDCITFGKYKWRVLDVKEKKALILTDTIIDQQLYHSKNEPVTWKDCTLRHYLNNEFLHSFTSEEQKQIIKTKNQNPGNIWYDVDGGEDTEDYIFIPSIDEVVRYYFGDSSALLDNPGHNQRYWFQRKDPNNKKRRSTYMDLVWWWWIRTPGKNHKVAAYVHGDGNIGIQGNGASKRSTNVIHPITNSYGGGVRPAMWIQEESVEKK